MPEIALFCEDSFHERFVVSMIERFARERSVYVAVRKYSARGGLPKVREEFRDFLRDLDRNRRRIPDLGIVVTDANCHGLHKRRSQLDGAFKLYPDFRSLFEFAIPDPHVERWMLADPLAFQSVFGRGCTLPAIKCRKDEYKKLLRQEIQKSGIDPALGGEEYAEDIVNAMDLGYAEVQEPSLGLFLKALKSRFNSWGT
ncbi:MAG: hypothetical protein U0Q16_18190 [Bryobacteraceae bacterium]